METFQDIVYPLPSLEEIHLSQIAIEMPKPNSDDLADIDYSNTVFPPLSVLEDINLENFQGPLPESNKVIEGLYAGAFPGDINDAVNNINLIQILNLGVSKFVCLQSEYNLNCPKFKWLQTGYRPYFTDVERILANKSMYELLQTETETATFEHLPIVDLKTTDDYKILALAKKLVKDYHSGVRMYIHCWGGHGRTGTVVCLMLYLMYGLSEEEIFAYCDKVHRQRTNLPEVYNNITCEYEIVSSPQKPEQFEQVRRIIAKHRFNKSICNPI
jgi:protein-tyrosine phosphatase